MSGTYFIDFHTHLNINDPLPVPENVLRVLSVPLEQALLPVPHNTVKTLELHPWQGADYTSEFASAAAGISFAGIGEVGLDRLKGKLPLPEQINIFTQTALLAEDLQKPLTIHCVKCFSELLAVYKKLRWKTPTVIHYFRGNLQLAQQLWQHTDFILSLPPVIVQQPQLLEFLRQNPGYLQRIVLETDDPDAGDIIRHYHNIAGILSVKTGDLQKIMQEQFERLYHV